MSRYYPVYLDLRGRPVTVVGGGEVAHEKVQGLLEAGARVRVIAPELSEGLQALADDSAFDHVARSYAEGDLAGAFLVIAERLGQEVSATLWREANERGIPINVQDETAHCSFIAAAVVRRGDLTVTISTAGKAPALAVRLRQELEQRLGSHHARFLELAGRLRAPLLERHPDFTTRRELWYRLVDSDVLELLRRDDEPRARRRIVEIMGVAPHRPAGREAKPAAEAGA